MKSVNPVVISNEHIDIMMTGDNLADNGMASHRPIHMNPKRVDVIFGPLSVDSCSPLTTKVAMSDILVTQ